MREEKSRCSVAVAVGREGLKSRGDAELPGQLEVEVQVEWPCARLHVLELKHANMI